MGVTRPHGTQGTTRLRPSTKVIGYLVGFTPPNLEFSALRQPASRLTTTLADDKAQSPWTHGWLVVLPAPHSSRRVSAAPHTWTRTTRPRDWTARCRPRGAGPWRERMAEPSACLPTTRLGSGTQQSRLHAFSQRTWAPGLSSRLPKTAGSAGDRSTASISRRGARESNEIMYMRYTK